MIELVEATEGLRVLLVTLKVGDHRDHTVVELLVTTTQTHEHLRHVSARTSLVGCNLQSADLHVVERFDDGSDLVVSFLRNWGEFDLFIRCTDGTQLSHSRGQAFVGHSVRVLHETAEWTNDRTTDDEEQTEEQQATEQGEQEG